MKQFRISLMLLALAGLMFAACSKEDLSQQDATAGKVTLTVQAGLPSMGTRAIQDYDGHAVKANHWIMEVLDAQGKLFYRDVKQTVEGTLQQTFKVTLIKNQTYDILFWADNDGGYYNTDTLTNVYLTGSPTYAGNADARDAFTACKTNYKSSSSEQISAELYRPFAQVNVIATDLTTLWQESKTCADSVQRYNKFAPKDYVLKIKRPTSFNVKTQLAGDTANVEITASESYKGYKSDSVTVRVKNNYELHNSNATLFMDYLFAQKDQKELVDMAFEFKTNGEKIEYSFTNVPIQANYRTNIKGKLLSNETKWTVDINPAWLTPDYEFSYAN